MANARRAAAEALKKYPGEPSFRVLLGLVALSENNIEEALAHPRAALEMNPQDADALHNLGLAYFAAGEHRAAIEAIEKALAIASRPQSMLALARIHDKAGDKARAVEYYRAYLAHSKPAAPFRRGAIGRLKELDSGPP